MQHALKFWNWLRLMDVGALNERLRAIDNRPYKFYRYIFEFCNTPNLIIAEISRFFKACKKTSIRYNRKKGG